MDGIGLVVGPEDELLAGNFDILHRAAVVAQNGVHIDIAPAIRLKRVVMAVEKDCGAGKKARVHAHAFSSVDLDDDETFPVAAITIDLRPKLLEEGLFEFDDVLDMHAGEERVGGGNVAVGEQNVLEFVIAGGQN